MKLQFSSDCYQLEVIKLGNPSLTEVPISYIITMHDSVRREQYMKQLEDHKPTGVVIVVHNMGFRKCSKPGVTRAYQDLWHANQFIAKYHIENFANAYALILEDDVQFAPNFRARSPIVQAFLRAKAPDVYSLGSVPSFTLPYDMHHLQGYFLMASAVIYSPSILSRFHELKVQELKTGHDSYHFWFTYRGMSRYMLRKPMAGQLQVATENSQGWDPHNIIIPTTNYLLNSHNEPLQWMETLSTILPFGTSSIVFALVVLIVVVITKGVHTPKHRTSVPIAQSNYAQGFTSK